MDDNIKKPINLQDLSNFGIRPLQNHMCRQEKKRYIKFGDVCGAKTTPILNDFIHTYTLSFVMALDKAELPKEVVREVMNNVYETSECMLQGYINLKDVETMCRDVYGINFVDEVKKKIYVTGESLIKR